jgi:hypothetical protein
LFFAAWGGTRHNKSDDCPGGRAALGRATRLDTFDHLESTTSSTALATLVLGALKLVDIALPNDTTRKQHFTCVGYRWHRSTEHGQGRCLNLSPGALPNKVVE